MFNSLRSSGGGADKEKVCMPFNKMNYLLMAVGVVVIVVGFMLMAGGGEHTSTHFDASIYSVRRITIAPIVVIIGFVIEIFAIMLRFGAKNKE